MEASKKIAQIMLSDDDSKEWSYIEPWIFYGNEPVLCLCQVKPEEEVKRVLGLLNNQLPASNQVLDVAGIREEMKRISLEYADESTSRSIVKGELLNEILKPDGKYTIAQPVDKEGGGCIYSKLGQGDCSHYFGLPVEFNDKTTDVYGKPLSWCWSCWKSHQIKMLRQRIDIVQPATCLDTKAIEVEQTRIFEEHKDDWTSIGYKYSELITAIREGDPKYTIDAQPVPAVDIDLDEWEERRKGCWGDGHPKKHLDVASDLDGCLTYLLSQLRSGATVKPVVGVNVEKLNADFIVLKERVRNNDETLSDGYNHICGFTYDLLATIRKSREGKGKAITNVADGRSEFTEDTKHDPVSGDDQPDQQGEYYINNDIIIKHTKERYPVLEFFKDATDEERQIILTALNAERSE